MRIVGSIVWRNRPYRLLYIVLLCLLSQACGVGKSVYAPGSLVEDRISAAQGNGRTLKVLCSKYSKIDLGGKTFYLEFDSPVDIAANKQLSIVNGTLVFCGARGFSFNDGSSLLAEKVHFKTNPKVKTYLIGIKNDKVKVKEVSFVDCHFTGNIVSRIKFNPATDRMGGIEKLVIKGCFSDTHHVDRHEAGAKFWIENGGYNKGCVIEGNRAVNMVGPFVYLSDRSSLLNENKANVVIKNNYFSGATGVSLNEYHCAVLVEVIKCHFIGNTIEGFVNSNTGESATAYDSYLSCNELYYENNTVLDVCAISDGGGKRAYCEWGKSKAIRDSKQYSCRVFKGNVFENNIETLASTYGVKKSGDYRVSLFHFSIPFDLLDVENNKFSFVGGQIEFPEHGLHIRSVRDIKVIGNEFVANTSSGSLLYCSADAGKTESIRITGNSFGFQKGVVGLCHFSQNKGYGYGTILMKDNTSSTGFSFSGFSAENLTFEHNTSFADEQAQKAVYYDLTDCESFFVRINKVFNVANQNCPDIFCGINGKGTIVYHINNLKNIPYIQFRVPYSAHDYTFIIRYKDNMGEIVSSEMSEYDVLTKVATGSMTSKKYLRNARGEFVVVDRNKTEGNPFDLAKKGIASSLQFDDNSQRSVIQVSGHHSTWPMFDFDSSYGLDIIFKTH